MPPKNESITSIEKSSTPEVPSPRKQTLDQCYIFNGITYGPGEAEVPADFPTNEELAKRVKPPRWDRLDSGIKAKQRNQKPDDAPEQDEEKQEDGSSTTKE